MSPKLRVLKKSSKSLVSGQSINDLFGKTSEEAVVVDPNENTAEENHQDLLQSVSTQNKAVDNRANKEVKDDAGIGTTVTDLVVYCDQIDRFLESAQNFLDRAYANDEQKILQRRLKNSVNELMIIQNQMKAVVDNIKAIKLQIAAVKNNIHDQKNTYRDLKNEEHRARFLLALENNKREKNKRSQEKNVRKDFENKVSKYFDASTVTGNSRPTRNGAALTNCFSFSNESEIPANIIRNSQVSNATNRLSRLTNRQLSPAAKRVKNLRSRKDSSLPPILQSDETGVTIFLRPIDESERTENTSRSPSRHCTPNPSILNFKWINSDQPGQAKSDTRTNSGVSASNSLFVFESKGRIEDLD